MSTINVDPRVVLVVGVTPAFLAQQMEVLQAAAAAPGAANMPSGAPAYFAMQYATYPTSFLQPYTVETCELTPPAQSEDDAYTRSNTGWGSTRQHINPVPGVLDYVPFVRLSADPDTWVRLDSKFVKVFSS